MAVNTKNKVVGDLIKYESHALYTRASGKIVNEEVNNMAAEVTDLIGMPVKAGAAAGTYALVAAGSEANVVGLIVEAPESLKLNANQSSTKEFGILVRGPAAVSEDAIATQDPIDGSNYNVANIKSALEGLAVPILVLSNPDEVDEQTT